ncbi:glutathione S-transferase C-terminal domain-containing protein [Brevundimonas sp.]|uniref:glutathione S-transferase C-terminal domain-containing protein n=1 Tax=Brevundimonas sp. TaxID=1871086 RepID=UPI0028A7F72C|nr:glutathione S-transferase C-terminal domain-containing protein [Brevundimonas sp.]
MKLYYSPLACSLADHIALREAGFTFDLERVDLRSHRTETGRDFHEVSAKGYVPVLVLAGGEIITENVAVLDWIATAAPLLSIGGPLGRTRVLEALTYITTEIHRAFKPMWHGGSAEEKTRAGATVTGLLAPLGQTMRGAYLFGDDPGVADFYLFVMLLWAERFGVAAPASLEAMRDLMRARPAVRAAMVYEGLLPAEQPA